MVADRSCHASTHDLENHLSRQTHSLGHVSTEANDGGVTSWQIFSGMFSFMYLALSCLTSDPIIGLQYNSHLHRSPNPFRPDPLIIWHSHSPSGIPLRQHSSCPRPANMSTRPQSSRKEGRRRPCQLITIRRARQDDRWKSW